MNTTNSRMKQRHEWFDEEEEEQQLHGHDTTEQEEDDCTGGDGRTRCWSSSSEGGSNHRSLTIYNDDGGTAKKKAKLLLPTTTTTVMVEATGCPAEEDTVMDEDDDDEEEDANSRMISDLHECLVSFVLPNIEKAEKIAAGKYLESKTHLNDVRNLSSKNRMLLEQVNAKSEEATGLALQLDTCRQQLKQLQDSEATNDGIRQHSVETEKQLRETKELLSEKTIELECQIIQNGHKDTMIKKLQDKLRESHELSNELETRLKDQTQKYDVQLRRMGSRRSTTVADSSFFKKRISQLTRELAQQKGLCEELQKHR